ncbi:undecaprenyldiphospho-muramoylpentapeptide beta-N-acetylglucosaminyltransferase [Thiopseudomonas denitrificans]|uniref:UDP-N-acetylglucosamine--N-acetylmuramyl-(pentapeptide) pyrophosphoryl-undecaprenol N-acetylglucosamine transferase n=1 Tax=Thiopseudomonas denitrificans TaxID=1501432 RepID=A0A4R6TYA9_9GAMM|nr:undecaprenyldiphospho-muramoylpentapeptide beta-N-acetylglucosaminyltransferase [Thiopseudomonas denitrificans]TDQ38910.1 UDP-N-acetylglucosamine-N-acetylmuramylpentapeptide N-acetylglucosamine transferase [Thiopseudomonas denitrificans]
MPETILIMAAGTGGHVFPALACAEELRNRGYRVHWLGAGRGIECRVVPAAGIELHNISATGLRGKGVLQLVLAPLQLLGALWQSWRLLRRIRPVCVLGMGGYVTGPGGLAARLCGVPLVIHEQNAVAGTANRSLARFAARICQAFPGAFADSDKLLTTGNPVRAELVIRALDKQQVSSPVRLLVVGGSLGAEPLNRLLPAALALLEPRLRPEVRHQCGEQHAEVTRQRYAEAAVAARVQPFIDDMAEAYAWADLVICRAGALTVSELAVMGRAAFLVPLPHAIDDHQSKNAEFLAQQQAALVLPQQHTSPEVLAQHLTEVFMNSHRLIEMAQQARKLARPQAAQQVVDACLEVARG